MKVFKPTLLAFATLSISAFGQFTAGNLAVVHVGDGAAALASAGAAVSIEEYNPLLGLANTYALPTSGGSAFIMTGNATAEGALARSYDGSLLTLAGYNVA